MDCDKFISAFDSYNLCLTGDVGRTLSTPSGGLNEHIPLIVLNDMGGSVMNVSDIPGTLRSQMKHHEPIVCFEPGIMSRDCSAGNRAYVDVCSTLRAQMGDNQPAVCYAFQGKAGSEASLCVGQDVSPTLRPAVEADVVYAVQSKETAAYIGCDLYNQVLTGDIACALTASMDVAGHSGPKVLIVSKEQDKTDGTVYAFKERAGCPGGGKGILVAENRAFTLATNFNGAICYENGE